MWRARCACVCFGNILSFSHCHSRGRCCRKYLLKTFFKIYLCVKWSVLWCSTRRWDVSSRRSKVRRNVFAMIWARDEPGEIGSARWARQDWPGEMGPAKWAWRGNASYEWSFECVWCELFKDTSIHKYALAVDSQFLNFVLGLFLINYYRMDPEYVSSSDSCIIHALVHSCIPYFSSVCFGLSWVWFVSEPL